MLLQNSDVHFSSSSARVHFYSSSTRVPPEGAITATAGSTQQMTFFSSVCWVQARQVNRIKMGSNGETVGDSGALVGAPENNLSPKFSSSSDFLQFIDFTPHNLLHCNATASKCQQTHFIKQQQVLGLASLNQGEYLEY